MNGHMIEDAITSKHGVMTSEGFIPHLKHPDGHEMPVVLDFTGYDRRTRKALPLRYWPPLRTKDEDLVWALPNGGRYVFGVGRIK